MQHYLVISRGNFYAEKQHSNKVLSFGTRGPVIMPHRVFVLRCIWACLSVERLILVVGGLGPTDNE